MADPKSKPLIVFIHGIAAHQWLFGFLRLYMKRKGYRTRAFGYRSVFLTIPRHAKDFRNLLHEIEADPTIDRFHIVAHSMGGIVARQSLLYFRPKKLHRFVMLATPNHGSAAARKLSPFFPFSKTLRQISDQDGSFVREQAFPTGVETGVIFASADRVVSRESSQPHDGTAFTEIYSGHNGLLVRPKAARAIEQFLSTGTFKKETG